MPLMIKANDCAQTQLILRNNFREIYFRENNLKLHIKIKTSLFNIFGRIQKVSILPQEFQVLSHLILLFKALGSYITIANCCHTQISEELESPKMTKNIDNYLP